MRPLHVALFAAASLAALLVAAPAEAQPRPPRPPLQMSRRPPSLAVRHPSEARSSLKARFGIRVAGRLLQADEQADRIRGIERLGAIGTREAIDALLEQLEQGSGVVARDPRARLVATRVLANHIGKDNVRQFLVREMTDAGTSEARGAYTPIGMLARSTAALALAKSGDKKALGALLSAVMQGGASAEIASEALAAYPPPSLESFLDGRKRVGARLATLLGELGDLRAIDKLRAIQGGKDPAAQTAAARALAKLGDESALPLAREWLKLREPRLRRAAAEVFVALRAPEAASSVAALLASDATRADGIRLAHRAPSPTLVAPLVAALSATDDDERALAIQAIGRAGGAPALAALKPLLDKPSASTTAAHALAMMPGDEARATLESELAAAKGARARLIARAGIVRALVLGDPPSGLRAALEAQWASKDRADRALAAFGLVALGHVRAHKILEESCRASSCDASLVGAAARGALARGDEELKAFAPILAQEAARFTQGASDDGPASELAVAAGVALLAEPSGVDISTRALASWAEAGGPLAALAARALPSRDDEALRSRLKRLLEGSDPIVRAELALGLGSDPEPSAVSLLIEAYRFEEDPIVRRAIVRALSLRKEKQRRAALLSAHDLDPDASVRALARAALAGRMLAPRVRSSGGLEATPQVAWITVVSTDDARNGSLRAARLLRSDGLAIPLLADPDGVLIVPGLPPGPASLLLAAGAE